MKTYQVWEIIRMHNNQETLIAEHQTKKEAIAAKNKTWEECWSYGVKYEIREK